MKKIRQMFQRFENASLIEILLATMAIFVTGCIMMLSGCELVKSLTGTASTIDNTLKAVDQNQNGILSTQEILQYCLMGWLGGRGAETAGKIGVKRFRNGRNKNGSGTDEQGSCP